MKIIGVAILTTIIWGIGVFIWHGDVIIANINNKIPYPFYNGNDHLIVHAGGAIDDNVYTDSREDIERSILES